MESPIHRKGAAKIRPFEQKIAFRLLFFPIATIIENEHRHKKGARRNAGA
jgi:hypothetical protein